MGIVIVKCILLGTFAVELGHAGSHPVQAKAI